MTVVALLAGIAAFIAVNAILAFIWGWCCGSSQTMHALLRFSVFALPIRLVCFVAALWAGASAFMAVVA